MSCERAGEKDQEHGAVDPPGRIAGDEVVVVKLIHVNMAGVLKGLKGGEK